MEATTVQETAAEPEVEESVARYAELDGRSAKALALACSTDKSRHILHHARVRSDGTFEATNGHILVRMKPTFLDEDAVYIREHPTIPEQDWLIHQDDLKRLKVSQTLRLDLESGELIVLDKERNPELAIPGGASTQSEEGPYPNTDALHHDYSGQETFRFALSGKYLKSIAKIAKASTHRVDKVKFTVLVEEGRSGGAERAVLWKTGETEGLLMPVRVNI